MAANSHTPAPPRNQHPAGPRPAAQPSAGQRPAAPRPAPQRAAAHPPASQHQGGHRPAAHPPTGHHHAHPQHPRSLFEQHFIGLQGRYWIVIGLLLGLCIGVYAFSKPMTPNAFDQPGAQVPNKLRSPWGVANPL